MKYIKQITNADVTRSATVVSATGDRVSITGVSPSNIVTDVTARDKRFQTLNLPTISGLTTTPFLNRYGVATMRTTSREISLELPTLGTANLNLANARSCAHSLDMGPAPEDCHRPFNEHLVRQSAQRKGIQNSSSTRIPTSTRARGGGLRRRKACG
jgi:hypothetical protein